MSDGQTITDPGKGHFIDPNSAEARSAAEGLPIDQTPAVINDPVDPTPAPPAPVQQQPAPPAPDPETPPLAADPRDAITRRFRERTKRGSGTPLNIDPESIPEGVPLEGQQTAPQPEEAPPAPRQEPAPQPSAKAPAAEYTLTVHGNTIRVNRDDVLRYAGFEGEEDAAGIPDLSLIKAAQINLAAEQNLQEAKAAKKLARQAAPAEGEHHAQQQPSDADAIKARKLELIETVQIGDPEAALAAQEELNRMNQEAAAAHTSVVSRIEAASARTERAMQEANIKDLLSDEVAADAFRGVATRKIVDELRKASPDLITDQVALELLNSPKDAIAAYHGALAGNRNVRPPEQLISEAAQTVRGKFSQPRPAPAPQPQPLARVEEKRGLMQQPTRTDFAPTPPQGDAPRPGHRDPSAVIRQMQRARHQASAF